MIVYVFLAEDPKDLIRKCLVVDPAQRITVKEVLRHPFFNQMVSDVTRGPPLPLLRNSSSRTCPARLPSGRGINVSILVTVIYYIII